LHAHFVREDLKRRAVRADFGDGDHFAIVIRRADPLLHDDLVVAVAVEVRELEARDHARIAHAELADVELLTVAVVRAEDQQVFPEYGDALVHAVARDVAVCFARGVTADAVRAEQRAFQAFLGVVHEWGHGAAGTRGARADYAADRAAVRVRVRD